MLNNFASGENGIIKTKDQLLVEAEKKIGDMENERRLLHQMLDQLKMNNAGLRVAVTALGEHYELTSAAMKAIVDKYQEDYQNQYLKLADDAKAKFMQDLKDGKVPKFETAPNPDAKE